MSNNINTPVLSFSERAVKDSEYAEKILESIQGKEIINSFEYNQAGETLKEIKTKYKGLDVERKKMTKPLDDSKKAIMDFFRKPLDFLSQAETLIKSAMVTYQKEQDRKRREEERKLAEEAKKQEEKEKAKLEKKAQKAEEKGDEETAEQLREEAQEVSVFVPVLPRAEEKVAGIAMKTVWKYQIIDVSKIPRKYMIPNEKMIGDLARSGKGVLEIPGVRIYSEKSISAGRS